MPNGHQPTVRMYTKAASGCAIDFGIRGWLMGKEAGSRLTKDLEDLAPLPLCTESQVDELKTAGWIERTSESVKRKRDLPGIQGAGESDIHGPNPKPCRKIQMAQSPNRTTRFARKTCCGYSFRLWRNCLEV